MYCITYINTIFNEINRYINLFSDFGRQYLNGNDITWIYPVVAGVLPKCRNIKNSATNLACAHTVIMLYHSL
jgi:hypothetical protein